MIKPLGFTDDNERCAFEVETGGGTQIMEIPVGLLPVISQMMTQAAFVASERKEENYIPPAFPVATWNVARTEKKDIQFRFYTIGGGGYAFHTDPNTARDIREALEELEGHRVQNTKKAN